MNGGTDGVSDVDSLADESLIVLGVESPLQQLSPRKSCFNSEKKALLAHSNAGLYDFNAWICEVEA